MPKTTEQLEHKRDRLRKNQVKDRKEVQHLRSALEHRGNQLANLSKRIRTREEAHPHIDDAGLDFITGHEGVMNHSYNDGAGNCTICIGHLLHMGACSQSTTAGDGQCRDYLRKDVQVALNAIKKYVRVKINQNQLDSLADFIFNIGTGAFSGSTLLRLLNNGDYKGAADQFLRWIYDSNHVAEPGLETRRKDEKALFLKG